mgnify:CR=1 FL=1
MEYKSDEVVVDRALGLQVQVSEDHRLRDDLIAHIAWRIVLPALKGEPHARARGVVEARLYRIPRAIAQQIADILKIKLRVRY